jgi:rhodanese-related sulfurtransferase
LPHSVEPRRAGGFAGCDPMNRRRALAAARATARLAGVFTVAAALAGCGTLSRWWDRHEAARPPFRTIAPAVAWEMIRDTPGIFILDLRFPEDFQGPYGHLRNAYDIPLARLPYQMLDLRAYNGETFLVYCDNDDCGRAGMKILQDSGFHDAILIGGGIKGWVRAGFGTYVRTGTLHPSTAVIKNERNPGLEVDSDRPRYELPVVPPSLPAEERRQPPS